MERSQDDTEFDPNSRAIRKALVEFVVEASLENPKRTELVNELLQALKNAPAKHEELAGQLVRAMTLWQHTSNGATGKLEELSTKLAGIANAMELRAQDSLPAKLQKEIAKAVNEAFSKQLLSGALEEIGESRQVTTQRLDEVYEEVRSLRRDFALRTPDPPKSERPREGRQQSVEVDTYRPTSMDPPSLGEGSGAPSPASEELAWIARPVPMYVALGVFVLLLLSVFVNVLQFDSLRSTSKSAQGSIVSSVPSPSKSKSRDAKEENHAAEESRGSSEAATVDPAPPAGDWNLLWDDALTHTVKSCRLKPDEPPQSRVSLRTCLCPAYDVRTPCELQASWDSLKLTLSLQAVMKSFDDRLLPRDLDGEVGPLTIGAARKLANDCKEDSRTLAGKINAVESAYNASQEQESSRAERPVAVNMRDAVSDLLSAIRIGYPRCTPPGQRGSG